jgi:hypothetical protein
MQVLGEIERRLAERLKYVTIIRRTFITFLQTKLQLMTYMENTIFFHLSLIIATIFLIMGIFLVIRRLSLFSFHPVFMGMGTFLFLGEGIVSHRNHSVLEALSPIMQHNKKTKVCLSFR